MARVGVAFWRGGLEGLTGDAEADVEGGGTFRSGRRCDTESERRVSRLKARLHPSVSVKALVSTVGLSPSTSVKRHSSNSGLVRVTLILKPPAFASLRRMTRWSLGGRFSKSETAIGSRTRYASSWSFVTTASLQAPSNRSWSNPTNSTKGLSSSVVDTTDGMSTNRIIRTLPPQTRIALAPRHQTERS